MSAELDTMIDILPMPQETAGEPLWALAAAVFALVWLVYRQWRRHHNPRRQLVSALINGHLDPRSVAHEISRLLPTRDSKLDQLRFQREAPDKEALLRYLRDD